MSNVYGPPNSPYGKETKDAGPIRQRVLCGRDMGTTKGQEREPPARPKHLQRRSGVWVRQGMECGKGRGFGKVQADLTREEGLSLESVRRNVEMCGP